MKGYNIILVDDHALFRSGLHLLLDNLDMVNNIYEASNGIEFLNNISKHSVDIVLMDINMPKMDGVEATKKALVKYPELKIIALSMYGDEEYYYKMINAGVKGFLLKDSDINEVKNAIQSVGDGTNYFSPEILYNLVKNINTVKIRSGILSERESEVLYHICKGLSNHEIADVLNVSKRTIDKHRENILSKTQSKNTASLIMYAIKNKLVKE
ncbi:MAG: response regulator transcription factor [Bacteroidales bacterium]|nr:response regulator transcription factor [Bacteroidales bacterium]